MPRHREGLLAAPCCWLRTKDELPGTPKQVADLLTTQEAHNPTAPLTRTWLIHYTVWMSTPSPAPRGLVSSPVVSTFPAEPEPARRARAPHVSIVLPCYNEQDHVLLEIERICAAMDASGSAMSCSPSTTAPPISTLAVLRRGRPALPAPAGRCASAATAARARSRRIGTQQARGEHRGLDRRRHDLPERARSPSSSDPRRRTRRATRWSARAPARRARSRSLRVPAKWFIRKLAERLHQRRDPRPELRPAGVPAATVALPYLRLLPPGFSCVTTITLAFLSNQHEVRLHADRLRQAGGHARSSTSSRTPTATSSRCCAW